MPQSYKIAGLQNDNIASDGEESKSRLVSQFESRPKEKGVCVPTGGRECMLHKRVH